ncbi:MAG: hypothetical protein H6720_15270 [Sandaracinus sp.]|nr:hypothetical protein [Myxococcales bacterium]MCB9601683.1 hypothetical protein [Sandaracinus sp.]
MFLRWLLTALVAAGLQACGDNADVTDAAIDVGLDAGLDAGRDAGLDSGRDASRDTARDVDQIDATVDAAGWVRLPDVPLGCVVERATHPERLFVPRWISCGDGCESLAPDDRWAWSVSSGSGGSDSSYTLLVLIAEERGVVNAPRTSLVVDVRRNEVVLALREWSPRRSTVCAVNRIGYSGGYVAYPLLLVDTEAGEEHSWIFHGPIETMKYVDDPVLKLDRDDLPGFGNVLQSTSASPTTAAFEVQPVGEVWIVEGGEVRRRAGVGSSVPGNPQSVALVGRRALWNEWREDVRIVQATFDDDASVFHEVEGARLLFATDGVDLAWVQAYGWTGRGFSGPVELWTASYTDSATVGTPRMVRSEYDLPGSNAVLGGGLWVQPDADGNLRLVHLEDGSQGRLLRPPGAIWLFSPVWVTRHEVGIAGRWVSDGRTTETFFRLATTATETVEE